MTVFRFTLSVPLGFALVSAAGALRAGAQVSPSPAPPGTGGISASSIQAADAAFREGYAASQRNDLASARASFEKVVQLAPGIAVGHSALGSVLLAQGDSARAVRELEAARQLGAADDSTLVSLCLAYSNLRDYQKTVATFREFQANSKAPGSLPPDAAVAVAAALSETGDAAEAESVLRQAVEASIASRHETAPLYDAYGTALARNQKYAAAATQLQRALLLDDRSASAHFHLGSVELLTNHPQEGLADLDRAHALDPQNIQYTLALAQALTANGEDTRAVEVLRAILPVVTATSQAIEIKYRLALALQSSGDAKAALPLFTEVVAARPTDASALTNAGLAHVQVGDAKGGIPLYLQALKLTPSDSTLREDLGAAYLQQADLDHAIEQFRAGIAVDSGNAQLHYDLGLALKLQDDLTAAVPEFERAAEIDPALPDPPYTLGIIYMQQGQFEKAASSLEKATALRPGNGDAWATLGSVYEQMQRPDKAEPALRQAIALLPQQPSPHINLATILAARGDKEGAAAERKIGAALTRATVNRQKANFGLDSGTLLMKRGQTSDALVQFQSAVEADPGYAAPHKALADALDRSGRKAEADEERKKAAAIEAGQGTRSQ
jgi:Flp pilus assembly protein TadD